MKSAREVAWHLFQVLFGYEPYPGSPRDQADLGKLTAAITADRASRGTGEREAGRREANDEGRHTVGRAMKMLGRAIYGALDINCGINGCSNTLYGLVTKACERLSNAAPVCDGCQGRGCSGCGGNGYRATPPAEPPTGHPEVAVRALEGLSAAAVSLKESLGEYVRQSMYFNPEWRPGLDAIDAALSIASRALAALRAAPAGPAVEGANEVSPGVYVGRESTSVFARGAAESAIALDTKTKVAGAWRQLFEERSRLWRAAEAKLRAIGELLEHNGCDCDCYHDDGPHEEDCDPCLACLVQEAMNDKPATPDSVGDAGTGEKT